MSEIKIDSMCDLGAVSSGAALAVTMVVVVLFLGFMVSNMERIIKFYEKYKFNEKHFNTLWFHLDEIINGKRYAHFNSEKIFFDKLDSQYLLCKTIKDSWFLIYRDGVVREVDAQKAKEVLSGSPALYAKYFGEVEYA